MSLFMPAGEVLPITLRDGATVTVMHWGAQSPRATVLCLPALGVTAAYYEALARACAAQGLATVTADLRGHGTSSVRARRGVEYGYTQLIDDTRSILETLRARSSLPLYVLGHSLGGHIAALTAARHPGSFDGLVLCACGTPYWRCFRTPLNGFVYGLALVADATGRVLGYFPGHRIGFGGRESAGLMREWAQLARGGRFDIEGFDAEATLAAMRLDTLFVSLSRDEMAPRAAVEHLADKLRSARIKRVHLDESTSARNALDHFRWAKSPEAVVGAVLDWLRALPSR